VKSANPNVRRLVGADFPGETLPDKWVLADLVLEPRESTTPPSSNFGGGGGADDDDNDDNGDINGGSGGGGGKRGWTSSFGGVGGGGDNPDVVGEVQGELTVYPRLESDCIQTRTLEHLQSWLQNVPIK
jgi:hypothetical protein